MKNFVAALVILVGAQATLAIHPSSLTATAQTTSARAVVGDKEILLVQARDEALNFINSQGKTRGPRLERALIELRTINPTIRLSDMDLAEKIVSGDYSLITP
ncbi:DUF2388 domain-containing protein [Bdellovibrio sp. HCB337]|uniref:DUF2388 domain-containing protein n=1 Tax=Bdellovibrio sp. HCB337 TaxID=3394358 RepID=UPI0039A6A0E5